MKKITPLLLFYCLLMIAVDVESQSKQKIIPECADISINGIYLNDPISSEKILGPKGFGARLAILRFGVIRSTTDGEKQDQTRR